MITKMLTRWSRAIVLLAVFGAVSNWFLSSLFESHVNFPLSLVTDGSLAPSSSSGHERPIKLTPMLRRPSITTEGHPIARQIFTQPSPHLWSDIPIVAPHKGQKKVLLTGAAGFIGSHVAEALLERGDVVIVVDEMNDYYDVRIKEGNLNLLREKAKKMAQRANKMADDVLKIYVGDINNGTMMRSIFDKHKPQWICHLAARAGVRPSIDDPLLYAKANILGTMSMLEYSREYNVTNVVISSSSSVYGESESTYFSEAEDVNKPVSPYAATKRSGELLSFTYHKLYDLKITNLRFFTVYGPRGRPDMAPCKFISQVIRGDVIEQYGDGMTSRDYTYIEDIVDGVIRAIDRPYPYEIINLGKGSGTKLNEFILLVERHVGKNAKIKLMPAQPGDVPFTNADISKAKMLLGYASKVSIEEGVRRTVSWFKSSQSNISTEDGANE
jgi:UDP-glucuronate 4-epimerase